MPTRATAAELLEDDHPDSQAVLQHALTPNPVADLACAYAQRVDTIQKLATFGVLSAGLSHHVLNPLSAIAANADLIPTFLQLVADRTNDPHINAALVELDEMATDIRAASGRILETVYGLGGLTSPVGRSGPSAIQRLLPVVEAAIAGLEPEMVINTTIHIDIPKDTQIDVETMSMTHVCAQLLTNAAEAGASNIWIKFDRESSPAIMMFEDDGHGVDPQAEPYIFDPFFSGWGRPKHFGMGLPSSQLLIESGGGKLVFERREAGGARFRIHFA
jgi:signal transduction histidine kinase